jgi:hypothetical protein
VIRSGNGLMPIAHNPFIRIVSETNALPLQIKEDEMTKKNLKPGKPSIVRKPDSARGGVTDEELKQMQEYVKIWTANALRTGRTDKPRAIAAIKQLYAVAGLPEPIVVVVPSPLVMVLAGSMAAAYYAQIRDATDAATRAATRNATLAATRDAAGDATFAATEAATFAATYAATRNATLAATRDAADAATDAATRNATYAATEAATRDAATLAATYYATDAATDAATRNATFAATLDATLAATRDATDAATRNATRDAAGDATDAATDAATRNATYAATEAATRAATRNATLAATRDAAGDATRNATDAATRDAIYAATRNATFAVTDAAAGAATADIVNIMMRVCNALGISTDIAMNELISWHVAYQGGNMWSAYECYLSAARDILGLRLPQHQPYAAWEEAAKIGGFRYMHHKFCLVTDFPDVIRKDDEHRPHCEDGPSHEWSDGWKLWHIEGHRVDSQLVLRPETQTITQIEEETNQDIKAIRIARFGWDRYLKETGSECLDDYENVLEGTMEALYKTPSGETRLVATCATGRLFSMGVPPEITTCEQARLWRQGGRKIKMTFRT